MHKVYRETADIRVAFETAMKRQSPRGEQVEMAEQRRNVSAEPIAPAPVADIPQEVPAATSRTKRALRPIAGALFRLAKPVLKPVAFRFRRFLMDGLRQEFLPLIAESRNEIAEVKSTASKLSTLIGSIQESVLSEISRQNSETKREILVTRNKLAEYSVINRSEVFSICNDILQRVSSIESISSRLDEDTRLLKDILDRSTSSERRLRKELSDTKSSISKILQVFPRLDRIEEYALAGARRIAVNCGPDDIIVNTMVGYVLCAATDCALVALLLDGGELERGTRLLIERLLGPGDTFVDVGANVGLHTLAAARVMKGTGKIIAFEPYGPTVRRLETTLWFNGFSPIVDLHRSAASNRFGVDKLYLGVTSGHHSLFPLETQESPGGQPVDVQLVTLDGTIEPGERIDLIKIDAEGAELDVLQGAMGTIRDNPEIGLIVEFGPSHLKRTDHTEEAWISIFTDLGFAYRAIHPLTGVLEDLPLEELKAMESVNLFFAQSHSSAWQKAQP